MKHYVALTCEALSRSIYHVAATSRNTITMRLYKQGLHNRPKNLRSVLQGEIDELSNEKYDAILLVYGMCGTATVGLAARDIPLVIPRAHDCITLYLGLAQRYQEEFERHPGTYWYSQDYMERQEQGAASALGAAGIADQEAEYEKYVAKFGKETADALMEEMRKWSQHYTRAVFIDTGLSSSEHYAQVAQEKAAREGWVYERMQGNNRLLRLLIEGEWNEEEFLVVPPGHHIEQTSGQQLICAVQS